MGKLGDEPSFLIMRDKMQNKWDFPIFQIVGYKKSGKTTVMQEIIRYFSSMGLQVGTLKHHGHGGEPEQVKETDSYKHLKSGAAISSVKGKNQFQITVNHATAELDELIQFYTLLPLDILLIEGYKRAEYPKIVLIRNKEDLQLLGNLSNIIAVGARDTALIKSLNYFTFQLEELNNFLPGLMEYITVKLEVFEKGTRK